jgi:hypothetical protein
MQRGSMSVVNDWTRNNERKMSAESHPFEEVSHLEEALLHTSPLHRGDGMKLHKNLRKGKRGI